MSDDNLKKLKGRLDQLDGRIRELLASTEQELKMARSIQSMLMPNRLPKFSGLEAQAKYISARELSSEFYDLIPGESNRVLWILQSWTSNFGLASLITQTFMTIQSQRVLAANARGDLEKIFAEIINTFTQLDDASTGNLRLMIRRLDMSHLQLDSIGFGFPPPLIRNQDRNRWGSFQIESLEHYVKYGQILEPVAISKINQLDLKKLKYHSQLKPGQRFYLMGSSWNPGAGIHNFFSELVLELRDGSSEELASPQPTVDSSLLDDLNYLTLEIQRALKGKSLNADICLQAFQTDKKLLHLA